MTIDKAQQKDMSQTRVAVATIAFVSVILSALLAGAHGDEGSEELANPKPKDLVSAKSYVSKKHGRVFAIVRKDGHLVGKPFVIELRPDCAGSRKSWKKLEVAEMLSACKIGKSPVSFDAAAQEFRITYFDADAADYNKRSMEANRPIVPICLKETFTKIVPVKDLCAPEANE